VEKIRLFAKRAGFALNLSPCNPKVGDPPDAYDVDSTPAGSGKDNVVRFFCERHAIPANEALAFGDIVGDLTMLRAVGRGYLVGNATDAARREFDTVLPKTYAAGIPEALTEVVQ
jgi:kanosamine-6-phosphate phosphatase